ncbi:hypothetical protein ATI61_11635 [Archangium gephyra]|uniref:Uncharacterized protein n=1 Tax=Archangium gephyra TaxID=48 RepID=A0AAC8QAI7_9BACT|nr:hypothetical protein [Archangium gephyra]AKJ03785.1 Hypothetical protein AA314_05411 [Archangium gephyra]REG23567.1 hypothetical protein ATI61_11635 [Archangium gephyra]
MSQAPQHPGTIVYVDGTTQKETERVNITEVPEALRFAPTPQGLVPVVRVVAYTEGSRRIIREYGPAGELLRSTVQIKQA